MAAKVREIGSRPGGRLSEDAPLLRCLRAVDSLLGIRAGADCASTDAIFPFPGHGGGARSAPAGWAEGRILRRNGKPEGRELGLKRILLTLAIAAERSRRRVAGSMTRGRSGPAVARRPGAGGLHADQGRDLRAGQGGPAEHFQLVFLALRFCHRHHCAGLSPSRPLLVEPEGAQQGTQGRRGGGLCLFADSVFQDLRLAVYHPPQSAFVPGSASCCTFAGFVRLQNRPGPSESWHRSCNRGHGPDALEGPSLSIATGDVLTAICAAAFALHIPWSDHYSAGASFEALSLIQIADRRVTGGRVLRLGRAAEALWERGLVAALPGNGIAGHGAGVFRKAWAQQRTTATRTALIFALEPVFAWMTSYLVFGESAGGAGHGGSGIDPGRLF